MDILWQMKNKNKAERSGQIGQLRNKVRLERSGHILAAEKKQKEVDRWVAAKKQSRKKWTDRRHLRKKLKEEDRLEAAKKQSRKKWTDGRQLRNKAERSGLMGGV